MTAIAQSQELRLDVKDQSARFDVSRFRTARVQLTMRGGSPSAFVVTLRRSLDLAVHQDMPITIGAAGLVDGSTITAPFDVDSDIEIEARVTTVEGSRVDATITLCGAD